MIQGALADEILRRRTFAIISHPDAGKTTITEKLLLLGRLIQKAGTVKGKKSDRHATSDWMAMEQQRGGGGGEGEEAEGVIVVGRVEEGLAALERLGGDGGAWLSAEPREGATGGGIDKDGDLVLELVDVSELKGGFEEQQDGGAEREGPERGEDDAPLTGELRGVEPGDEEDEAGECERCCDPARSPVSDEEELAAVVPTEELLHGYSSTRQARRPSRAFTWA
jgi:hypothetical protein